MDIQKKEVQLEKIENFAFDFSNKLLSLAKESPKKVISVVYFELQDIDLLTKAYINTFLASIVIDNIKSGHDLGESLDNYFKVLNGLDNEDVLLSLDYFMENLPKEVPTLSNNRVDILSAETRKKMIDYVSNIENENKAQSILQIIYGDLNQIVIKSNVDKKIRSSMH